MEFPELLHLIPHFFSKIYSLTSPIPAFYSLTCHHIHTKKPVPYARDRLIISI